MSTGTLERIATALEAIAANGGKTVTAAAPAAATEKPAAAPKAAAPKAAAPKAEKPAGVSQEAMQASLIEVKEKFGMPEAKAILKSFGYEAMAGVQAKDYQAVYDAAKKKIEGGDDDTTDDDGL